MSRRVKLRRDVHAHAPAFQDKRAELLLCIIQVFVCQVCFVESFVSASHNVRFQAEPCVCQVSRVSGCRIILIEDKVVIEMNMELVHLVICHLLCNIFQRIHGDRLARHIKHEAAHFVFGIVPGSAFWHCAAV